MRRVAVLLVMAGLLGLLGATPAHARQEGPAQDHVVRSSDGVYVLGDSLTRRGKGALLALEPTWSVNGVDGRPTNALPRLVRNLLRVDRDPAGVVIALGSNQSRGWTRADLLGVIQLLPETTYVVLVTTYKDARRWGRAGVQATYRYNRWMTQIAATRPWACLVPWRTAVLENRDWLVDGLHATPEGYRERAAMIVDALYHCQ